MNGARQTKAWHGSRSKEQKNQNEKRTTTGTGHRKRNEPWRRTGVLSEMVLPSWWALKFPTVESSENESQEENKPREIERETPGAVIWSSFRQLLLRCKRYGSFLTRGIRSRTLSLSPCTEEHEPPPNWLRGDWRVPNPSSQSTKWPTPIKIGLRATSEQTWGLPTPGVHFFCDFSLSSKVCSTHDVKGHREVHKSCVQLLFILFQPHRVLVFFKMLQNRQPTSVNNDTKKYICCYHRILILSGLTLRWNFLAERGEFWENAWKRETKWPEGCRATRNSVVW